MEALATNWWKFRHTKTMLENEKERNVDSSCDHELHRAAGYRIKLLLFKEVGQEASIT